MKWFAWMLSVVLLGATGCGPSGGGAASGGEPAWGVGSKADDGSCDPRDDLCWSSEDSMRMKRILGLCQKVALGEADPQSALDEVLQLAPALDHKLDDTGRAVLVDIATGPGPDPVEDLMRLRDEVFDRPASLFYAAYMALAGRRAELEEEGGAEGTKTDDGSAEGYETWWGVEVSEDMAESLAIMKQSCVLGQAYALLLELSGVLDVDFEVLTRDVFFAWDPELGREAPCGSSRYERSESIIFRYSLYAGGVGAAVGLVRTISIATIPVAAALEVCTLFPLHSRMVFKIAGVYGVDIGVGRNLLTASMAVVNGELNHEAADVLAACSLSDIFEDAVERRMSRAGFLYTGGLVSMLVTDQVIKFLSRRSEVAALVSVVHNPATKRVLGWVVRGLSLAAAGITDWFITDKIGENAAVCIRRWLVDLGMDGTPYLASVENRDCGFAALGAMAWADGEVSEREKRLYTAMLAKPYYLGGSRWYYLTPTERVERARALAGLSPDAALQKECEDCSEDLFEDFPARQKIALLSLVYAMMKIDLEDRREEQTFYARMRGTLDGRSWLGDGPAVDEKQLAFVERYIHMLLHPLAINDLTERSIPELADVEPEDLLGFLRKPDPEAWRDFRCGFEGICP